MIVNEKMNSDSSSDDGSISRDSMAERKPNNTIHHPKPPPPPRQQTLSRTNDRRQHSKLFEKVKLDSEDHDEDDEDDQHENNHYDDSDHSSSDEASDEGDENNDGHRTYDDDDDDDNSSRSEFEDDDDEDDDNDDQGNHDVKGNDDHLRHLPLSERLRHIQMEQGMNREYKEQRKRKYEQSQQQIQNVKAQILQKKREGNGSATNDVKKQSKVTNHDIGNKKSKHAPTVMSSKRSDFYHRQRLDLQGGGIAAIGTNIQAHTNVYKGRDPRSMIDMTSSSSTNNQKNSSKRGGKKLLETIKGTSNNMNDYQCEDYAFLQEMRNEEIQTLQKRIKARQLTGRKGQEHRRRYNIQNDNDGLAEDQRELHRLQQEKAAYERKQLEIATKRAVQQKLREGNANRQRNHSAEADGDTSHNNNDDEVLVQQSQQSSKYVPKVRELKRMYLETKYDLLSQQKKGKATIDKMILKKHMKNKSKDSKKQYV